MTKKFEILVPVRHKKNKLKGLEVNGSKRSFWSDLNFILTVGLRTSIMCPMWKSSSILLAKVSLSHSVMQMKSSGVSRTKKGFFRKLRLKITTNGMNYFTTSHRILPICLLHRKCTPSRNASMVSSFLATIYYAIKLMELIEFFHWT